MSSAHLAFLGSAHFHFLWFVFFLVYHGYVGGAAFILEVVLLLFGEEVVKEARGGTVSRREEARGGGRRRGRGFLHGGRGGRLAVRGGELLIKHHLRMRRQLRDLHALDTLHFLLWHPLVLDPVM